MSENDHNRTLYLVRCPDKYRWTEDFSAALEIATGKKHTEATGDEHEAAEIIAMFPGMRYERYAWLDDDAEEIYGRECPECGVGIDAGSLRWNGRTWEHKNPNVTPQAGHHVIRSPDTDQ